MCDLAGLYATGEGVIKNNKEALKWLRKAAELGEAEAMWLLGSKYAIVGADGNDNPHNSGSAYTFTIPEPGTMALLAIGTLAVCRRRRR